MSNKLNSRLLKRIQMEIKELGEDTPYNCSAGPTNDDDITKWTATIIGPKDTPYAGDMN